MKRLDRVTLDALHAQLERTEGNVPTQRVLAAIGWKQGATLEELAERHDVAEKTVRNWLDRFEARPLEDAPYDDERSGRPRKLGKGARRLLQKDLQRSPTAFGYEQATWNPDLLRRHIRSRFDIEYSRRHVYRVLEEAEAAR